MSNEDADKALRLVRRYARLQVRMHQCKRLTGRLFDACEKPWYHQDEVGGSGCVCALREAKEDGLIKYGPDRESNFGQVMADIDFCRPCKIGMAVSKHRKRKLNKRRTSVLGAMKRLGSKAMTRGMAAVPKGEQPADDVIDTTTREQK